MRNVTLALVALAAAAVAPQAAAQCTGTAGTDFEQVTVREINAIPQTNIDALNASSAAGTLTIEDIQAGLTNDLEGEIVEFQAVVLTDPILSGLASPNDGIPGRIHVFVRDVNALNDGPAGMGIQIVDGRTDRVETQNLFVGDEIVVCGTVSPFVGGGKSMQISPISVTIAGTPVIDLTTNPEFDDPVVATTSDFHDVVNDLTQIDWDSYSDFNGQYVRLENATIVQGVAGSIGRPNVLLSSDPNGAQPQINLYDTSVCFRNDRGTDYFPAGQVPDCISNGDFVPPTAGFANTQGFLIFQGFDGTFGFSDPGSANFVLNPFVESDFEITSAPPIVQLNPVGSIPAPADDVTISASAVAGEGSLTGVAATYRYVLDGTEISSGSITLSNTTGDTYEGTIPAFAGSNKAFVEFTITATDDGGTTDIDGGYRVFEGSVDSIALIQTTALGVPSASPLYTGANGDDAADDARTFDLDAVVQEVFQRGSSWYGTLQEDVNLGPWTGIWAFFGSSDPGLSPGDRINITEAAINERFGVTQLQDLTFTTTSSGDPYAYKSVDTGVLTDDAVAEAHEGMLISFDDVTITDNDSGFGEWTMSTNGTAGVDADDWSDAFESDYSAMTFANGEVREFIRGIWYFSFGEYKLVPVDLGDIGGIVTANEGGVQARSIRIEGARPNPASGTATVAFELDVVGPATLRLFDVTGRQVATLAEGEYTAESHTAELNVAGLAPGVYILRLEAAGEVATARMAVVR